MTGRDLAQLDKLLSAARSVVAMRDVHEGARDPDVIGLRHDVDDNPGALDTAVKIAAWEAGRGYRSTYFILHTARYWRAPGLERALDTIAGHGHEIGIHANALAAALTGGGDPHTILAAAIGRLRELGHTVVGVAGHGDRLCHQARFVNDEQFVECARPNMGDPDRILRHAGRQLRIQPRPLADFGLEYETLRLPRGRYLSDSGGHWNITPAEAAAGDGQLHILQHPDWWAAALKEAT